MAIDLTGNIGSNEARISVSASGDAKVMFRSEGCSLQIGEQTSCSGLEIHFNRQGSSVTIGDQCTVKGALYLLAPNTHIVLGRKVRCNGFLWANLSELDTKISIGSRCLLSNVKFRTSDSHKIFDIASGNRLNPAADIVVGDEVWLAEDVLLLRGADVGAGSVIGARSMVNGKLPPHCLAAGAPARVLREGIRWEE